VLNTRTKLSLAIMLFLAGWPAGASAEVLGPLLSKGTLEIGIMEREVDRVVEGGGKSEDWKWWDYPVTIRYGVTANATVSFELSGDPNAMFNEIDVVQYTVGAGISTLVWSHDEFLVSTGLHYYRRLDVYGEPGWCDFQTQGIDWELLGQQPFEIGRVGFTIWGGPTVSYVVLQPQAPCVETNLVGEQVFGGVVGATLPSRMGIVLQGSFVWIDDPEYRLNLGFRF